MGEWDADEDDEEEEEEAQQMFLVNLTSFWNHDGLSLHQRLQRPRELQEHDMWREEGTPAASLYVQKITRTIVQILGKEGFMAELCHCSMEFPDWSSHLVYG